MRYLPFSEPDVSEFPWYTRWKEVAARQTKLAKKATKQGLPYKFKDAIWGQVKDYLFDLFDGKCAYCESYVRHISYGDVDHFAPKSAAPWLAYDLRNLLPSCEKCNRAGGKMNQFPGVERFLTVRDHEAIFKHQAAGLLHPRFHQQLGQHLAFTPPDLARNLFPGTLVGLTDDGRSTIDICNLNRDFLVEKRRESQELFFKELIFENGRMNLQGLLQKTRSGKREFSAALIVVAKAYRDYVLASVPDD